jgi:hypothetical protein
VDVANKNPSPETRFPPGRSGNPAGSSRRRRLADLLRDKLFSNVIGGSVLADGQCVGDLINDVLIKAALTGDRTVGLELIREIYLRADGPPKGEDDESAGDDAEASAPSQTIKIEYINAPIKPNERDSDGEDRPARASPGTSEGPDGPLPV